MYLTFLIGFVIYFPDLPTPEVIGIDPDSNQKPIVSSVDPYSFFSPSAVVGLTTPPPSQMTPVSTDHSKLFSFYLFKHIYRGICNWTAILKVRLY